MEYEINKSGEAVRIDVLANADWSVLGLQIGNSRIKLIPFDDLVEIVVTLYGKEEINHFKTDLLKYQVFPSQEQNIIIVMETTGTIFPTIDLDYLKLNKSNDILSCYFFVYKFSDNQIQQGGHGRVYIREHFIQFFPRNIP